MKSCLLILQAKVIAQEVPKTQFLLPTFSLGTIDCPVKNVLTGFLFKAPSLGKELSYYFQ